MFTDKSWSLYRKDVREKIVTVGHSVLTLTHLAINHPACSGLKPKYLIPAMSPWYRPFAISRRHCLDLSYALAKLIIKWYNIYLLRWNQGRPQKIFQVGAHVLQCPSQLPPIHFTVVFFQFSNIMYDSPHIGKVIRRMHMIACSDQE